MRNINICANRLPVSIKSSEDITLYKSIGGVASTFGDLNKYENIKTSFVGWSGIDKNNLPDKASREIANQFLCQNCFNVGLQTDEIEHFYNGYCNAIIYPSLLGDNSIFDLSNYHTHWQFYEKTNKKYAKTLSDVSLCHAGDIIWLNDYHLMRVPLHLRKLKSSAKIVFFLHTPFPDYDHFQKIPHWKELLIGLQSCDLIGFHTKKYAANFLTCLSMINKDMNRPVVKFFPLGINTDKFKAPLFPEKIIQHMHYLKTNICHNRKCILSIDRCDPIKGILQRLKAFQACLEQRNFDSSEVCFIIVAIPTRQKLVTYKKLADSIDRKVKDINARFSKEGCGPVIHHITKPQDDNWLIALYRTADVLFVPALGDGMNLVCKEFIASKCSRDKPGIVILSENMGATIDLKCGNEGSLVCDPVNAVETELTLQRALQMGMREREVRLKNMRKSVERFTSFDWAYNIIAETEYINP